MKVSVVMPVYNGRDYLKEAMDSILNQTYRDFEFIIINDCSTDDTQQIIDSYADARIVCLRNEQNLGVARSLNRGLDAAQGEYIARMDADDIARPDRLALQTAYMDAHPEIPVLATASQSFDETGVLFEGHSSVDPDILKLDFLFSCGICHPTVMLRRAVLEQYQLRYDHSFNKIEDYELWCRMMDLGLPIACLDVILLDHRLHQNQVTSVYSPDMLRKLETLYRRNFAQLGIEPDAAEFDAFFAYCLQDTLQKKPDYRKLCSLLEKALSSGHFEPRKTKKYCRGLAVRAMRDDALSIGEMFSYAKASPFLNFTDVLRFGLLKR